jgi:carboxyl-terminal processing protease
LKHPIVWPRALGLPLLVLPLLLFGAACATAPPAAGVGASAGLEGASGRVAAAEAVDAHVRRHFAHWEGVPHLDYAAAVEGYGSEAALAEDRRAFAFATMRFLALLENGHTDVGDAMVWREMGAPLPFTLRHVEEEWVVSSSRDDRIAAGSVIREIDGQPFEAFFREARSHISSSDERWARRILGSRPFLFPERFVLSLADGSAHEVERRAPVPAAAAPAAQGSQEWVPHRWLVPDSVALLRLSTFGRSEVEERALELLRAEIGSASALVLDLRGNGGGNTPWKLRKALLRGRGGHEWRWRTVGDRTSSSLLMRLVAPLAVRLYRPPPWEGLLVLLVDGGCFSACEDLVGSLRGAPGVRLVGETTGGSSGQPVSLTLAEGFSVRVSARRQALPDGTPFEGRGIVPDLVVERSIEDLRTGSDPALAAALEEARCPPHSAECISLRTGGRRGR